MSRKSRRATRKRARRPVVGRWVVATTLGIIAASQPLAARAGVQMLERGGNAIDTAIAANATIGLMEPTGNGIGGDLHDGFFAAAHELLRRVQCPPVQEAEHHPVDEDAHRQAVSSLDSPCI